MDPRRLFFYFFVSLFMVGCTSKEEPMRVVIEKAMSRSAQQYKRMSEYLIDSIGRYPRTYINGKIMTSDTHWWCSGFFPGSLWYLYEYSKDNDILNYAKIYTERLRKEMYETDNHDIGFMIFCSYGNGYRLTGNEDYASVIDTACISLSSRYQENMGLIRSWDFNKKIWQYPVIIDNMMNLEMLMWGAKKFNNDYFKRIAINHADKTMHHHFRKDYSSYHLVSYDTITSLPHVKQTHQGYSDESAWARGQAWGLYGYTYMYRFTKDIKYLDMARNIAKFMISHPNMPSDMIPYWDYNAPNIPNEERDASAAAVMASALLELSEYVTADEKKEFISVAEKQIRTLSSNEYLADEGDNGLFILKHSVGSKPFKENGPFYGEVDAPLTYADYYYLEAMIRWLNLNK